MSQSGPNMFSVGMELEKAQNMVLLLSVNPESVEAGRASVQGFQGTSKEKEKPGGVLGSCQVFTTVKTSWSGDGEELIGNHPALGSIRIPRMSRSILSADPG